MFRPLQRRLRDELKVFVPMLEKAGVTSFHVTLANHSDLENTIPPKNHPYFGEPGCFLKFCDEVRQYTNLPICGVGGLTDPVFVEPTLTELHINSVLASAFGIERIRSSSLFVIPFDTIAE